MLFYRGEVILKQLVFAAGRVSIGLSLLVALLLTLSPAHAHGVVGTGTPESCSEEAFDTVFAGGNVMTFQCGPNPFTLTLTSKQKGRRVTNKCTNTRVK